MILIKKNISIYRFKNSILNDADFMHLKLDFFQQILSNFLEQQEKNIHIGFSPLNFQSLTKKDYSRVHQYFTQNCERTI